MSFVNEYISQSDMEKYKIEEIDKRFIMGGVRSPQWTINRVKSTYLRCVARGREESSRNSTWTFYWKDELLVIKLRLINGGGRQGEPGWSHWKFVHIDLPDSLSELKAELIKELKEALTAYKDGGVFSVNTTYKVTLDT